MERANGLSDAQAGWITKLLYRAFRKRLGLVPKAKRLTAYNTPTLLASTWMDAACASAKTIPIALKELAQLKVAALVGCPFWIDIHSAVGRKAGITEGQLHDLAYFEGSTAFTGKERLILRLAVALTKTPASVSDELFADLRREFSEPQLVELTTAIAWENYRARFNRTFGIAAEGFSEGAFCPLPEHP